jgi:hypothetical protein
MCTTNVTDDVTNNVHFVTLSVQFSLHDFANITAEDRGVATLTSIILKDTNMPC